MEEFALKATLLKNTHEEIIATTEALTEKIQYGLDSYFKELVRRQAIDVPPVSAIHISFLYTSLYFGNPQFQIDAYGENLYLEPSYLTTKMKADWLFKHWEAYEAALTEEMKKDREIFYREALMYQISTKSIKNLLYYIYTSFKYIMRECENLESLKVLQKTEEFYISFGEYRDWQRPIYGEYPEIDLFNCEEDAFRKYRRFEKAYYKQKAFLEWDLYQGVFEDCHFRNTHFNKTTLNDERFKNCIFDHVVLEEVNLYGVTFENCHFKEVSFKNCLGGIYGLPPEAIQEVYKNAEWLKCQFEATCFEACNLSFNLLLNCDTQGLEIINCELFESEFAPYA